MSMLVVMGSGETAPSLVKVHREIDLATPGDGPAVLLDTTFGFQVNADDLVDKISAYFASSVGLRVEVATWRRADAPHVELERALALLGRARWAFAGPGSPTYTLRHWRGTEIPAALADIPARGGTLVFGSAAACTLGTHAIPVYEIYKAGADPYWEPALDLLRSLTGLGAAVVPHYDNAEGGRYDTRYCYLGEERLALMERHLPEDVGVLGVDEHTALLIDLAGRTARVAGSGTVTVRRRDGSRSFPAGSRLSLDSLDALLRGEVGAGTPLDADGAAGAPSTGAASTGADGAGGLPSPRSGTGGPPSLRRDADGARAAFEAALAEGDADGCVSAILDLEEAIVAWSTDTDQNDDLDHARRILRALVVRLGDVAAVGVRDPGRSSGPMWRHSSSCAGMPARPATTGCPTSSGSGWSPPGSRSGTPRTAPSGSSLGRPTVAELDELPTSCRRAGGMLPRCCRDAVEMLLRCCSDAEIGTTGAGIVLRMSGQQSARDDAHQDDAHHDDAGQRAVGPFRPAGSLLRMVNPIRDYDWGSVETLARMQRRQPRGAPEAELWMGAHPAAPSMVLDADGAARRLDELVAAAPREVLGSQLLTAFGARLPFLLKVLAIARPLSLQVHPDRDRAREGFAGEVEVLGEHRYVDPYPKPELMYALEPVEALCGFRPAADAVRLLAELDGPRAATIAEPLHLASRGADTSGIDETRALEEAFRRLVTWPDDDRADLAADAADEAARLLVRGGRPGGPELSDADRRALEWVTRLADQHPKDALVVAPLLLDLVLLEPGETLFVPAGAPHAYLHGTGVEIMGNSDNVLRAGLTHKAIAVDELLHVVDGRSRPHRDLPEVRLGDHEVAWRPAVPEFQLTRLRLPSDAQVEADAGLPGPQIVLCTTGRVSLRCGRTEYVLQPAESVFVPAGAGSLVVAGPGEVFRAAAGAGVDTGVGAGVGVARPAPPG